MTKQEYEKRLKQNLKHITDLAGHSVRSGYELFNEAMVMKMLNDLKMDELSIEIAYLKSRVEALEKLISNQTAERTDENE